MKNFWWVVWACAIGAGINGCMDRTISKYTGEYDRVQCVETITKVQK